MDNPPTPSSRAYRGITLSAALIAAGVRIRLDLPTLDGNFTFDQAVLARTMDDPYRYRILGAYLVDALARLTPSYKVSFTVIVVALEMLALVIFVMLLGRWLRLFAGEALAALATVFTALVVTNVLGANPVGYMWLEPAFVTAALLWLWNFAHGQRAHPLLYALLVVAACLNRETGLYLVALYGVTILPSRKVRDWVWGAVYAALGIGIFGLLRVVLGTAGRFWTLERIVAENAADPLITALAAFFLFGAYWWFAWRGRKYAPPFLRRLVYTLPLYLIPVLVFGIWSETRLFMPIAPLLLALAVCAQEKMLRADAPSPTG